MRFLQLKRALGHVSQRMLTRTLKKLEQLGVVSRTTHQGLTLQVSYELTDSGRVLYAGVQQFREWLDQHQTLFTLNQSE